MQPSAGSSSGRPGPDSGPGGPGLKRVLGLPALVLYGLILIQPTAPMPLYGNVAGLAHGHVVTTVLVGMVAMLFTAIAYGRMANAYPSAGSAYTYVGREIHPALGYLVGWGMIFDYVMNPIICVIWSSQAALALQVDLGLQMPALFTPKVLFVVYVFFFTILFTGMNVRGIEASSRTNTIIAAGLGVVIVLFLAAAAQYLWAQPPAGMAGWTRPFYDPKTFSFSAVSNGAALAVLTYIGFDGISTLSEEVHNPRRNILLATVLVCVLTGVLASIQVYAAQLVWPDVNTKFSNPDLAFCYVAGKAGGRWLFLTVDVALLIATIGSGAGAQLGAGRLLYGMGRDNAIPRRFFGFIHPRTRIPSNNILLVGAFTLLGAFTLTYGQGAELLNFGALVAFMGVNVSSFVRYFVRGDRKPFKDFLPPIWMSKRLDNFLPPTLMSLGYAIYLFLCLCALGVAVAAFFVLYHEGATAQSTAVAGLAAGLLYLVSVERKVLGNFLPPVLGFGTCLFLWLSLGRNAKWAGLCWLTAGLLYGTWRTSWFRKPLDFQRVETAEEEQAGPRDATIEK